MTAIKKNVLGRGLGALIEDYGVSDFSVGVKSSFEVDIAEIEANPYQPREKFEEESLKELAASIKNIGIIQPITVRKISTHKYQLIAGERRFRASQMLGLKTIPAFVRVAEDNAMLEMALIENIQREDLNPMEVALSFERLIEECSLTQESLSERVGLKRSTISNYLRLMKLPAIVQLGLRQGKLTMGHARTLVNIEDEKIQLELYHRIVMEDLSVRRVEELVRELGSEEKKEEKEKKEKKTPNLFKEYDELSDKIATYFSSKVELKINENGAGKIIIPFDSNDDLERIIGILDK